MNIISKNFFDICVSCLAFYLCGYSFSTNANGGIIGQGKFLSLEFSNENYLDWFYKYSLCSASSTIVSGSLAERCFVDSYIVFSVLMGTVIYPICSSWTLGEGWLHSLNFHDAAGAGSIHMLGGAVGFMGTWLLGPRSGIFDKTTVNMLVKAAEKKRLRGNSTQGFGGRLNQKMDFLYKSQTSDNTYSSTSSIMVSNVRNFMYDSKHSRHMKQYKSFYNFDEDTPMKFRIFIFRQQFKEFSTLKQDQCIKLIQLYDKNLNKSHELNSS